MMFASLDEVQLAYALGKIGTHAAHQGPAAAKAAVVEERAARQARRRSSTPPSAA